MEMSWFDAYHPRLAWTIISCKRRIHASPQLNPKVQPCVPERFQNHLSQSSTSSLYTTASRQALLDLVKPIPQNETHLITIVVLRICYNLPPTLPSGSTTLTKSACFCLAYGPTLKEYIVPNYDSLRCKCFFFVSESLLAGLQLLSLCLPPSTRLRLLALLCLIPVHSAAYSQLPFPL